MSTFFLIAACVFAGYLWLVRPVLHEQPYYWNTKERLLRQSPRRFAALYRDLESWYRYPTPERVLDCEPLPALPEPRFEAPSAVVGRRIYVFGGFHTDTLHATNRVFAYDADEHRWGPAASMPTTLTHHGLAVDNDVAWIAGGFVGDHPGVGVADVWRYDTGTDVWRPGPPLPEKRAGGALVRVGRQIHWIGGLKEDRQTDSPDHWFLDLDAPDSWRPLAPLPEARNQFGAAVVDGLIYVIGGSFGHDKRTIDVDLVHRYDPAADRWTQLRSLPQKLSHVETSTFVSADGRIVVAGGRSGYWEMLYDLTAYDPKSDTWEALPSLPAPLRAPIAIRLDGRIFLGGGGSLPSGISPTDVARSCLCEGLSL